MLLSNPTTLPAMLPNDPSAAKSSDEPLRGRIDGNMGSVLLLLLLLLANEVVVAVAVWAVAAVAVVGVWAAAGAGVAEVEAGLSCSCCRGAAGEAFTRVEAAFEAMAADCGT